MLADDHQLLRSGIKLLLQLQPGIEVVGEAADGWEAIKLFEQLRPDILLLDISLPGIDGLDCLQEIRGRYPEAKIIMLTMHDAEYYVKRAMQAGAAGYLHKSQAAAELYQALDVVRSGEIYLRQYDSKRLLNLLLKPVAERIDANAPFVLLSPREREVLRLLVRGYSLAEVAAELSLSIKTIDTYKTRLMDKLKASRKSELVTYALRYGLLQAGNGD